MTGDNGRMEQLPIACTLGPAALKARREDLLNALLSRSLGRSELPDGISLRFAAGTGVLSDIAQAVEAERQCCRFLQFTIGVAPNLGEITLDLVGPPGTREFLAALLDVR